MIQRPRGTRDFTQAEMERRRFVENSLRKTVESFGYREVTTPVFEHSELFTLKSGTEIAEQLYIFKDKSDRELCLRPELTAPVARFYISDLKALPKPLKVYYFGNCFRYERPQKGRFREFWQFGVELIGSGTAECEAELIALAMTALKNLNLKKFKLRVGHLGILKSILEEISIPELNRSELMKLIDKADFENVERALTELKIEPTKISKIMQLIKVKGDFSILDKLKLMIAGNEKTLNTLNEFREILGYLRDFGITDITVDLGIARGLDYYTGIVFEIDVEELGAEKQVCGGGSYSLIETFGGPKTETTGFAFGFDRVVMALETQAGKLLDAAEHKLEVYIIPLGEKSQKKAFEISMTLRAKGMRTDIDLKRRGLEKNLKYANSINAEKAIILGDRELDQNIVQVRDMATGTQTAVKLDDLIGFFTNK